MKPLDIFFLRNISLSGHKNNILCCSFFLPGNKSQICSPLHVLQRDIYILLHSFTAFSSGKVDAKNKLFPLWIQTSLICVLCILQLLSTKEMYVVAHSIFFSFLKSKGVISAEIFTFDFVLGWHKTWHFALKGLFSDSVFLCCGSKIMGIN